MEPKKPHCSSLDRILACNAAILPTSNPKESGGADAVLGRARHEALAHIPKGIDPPSSEIAARYGVDLDEIDIAVTLGRQAWDEVGEYFPSPQVEVRLESKICVGTADVLQVEIDDAGVCVAIRVLDWKTGFGTDLHRNQLLGYAHGAVEKYGWPLNGVVSLFEVWTTHKEIRTTNIERDELGAFAGRLAQVIEVATHDPARLEYQSGSHCQWCPRQDRCPAYAQWMRRSVAALTETPAAEVTPYVLGSLYDKAREIDRAMRRYWAAVDAALEEGPIPMPDGRELHREYVDREKIRAYDAIIALRACGMLAEGDEDALLGDVPKSALDAWAKANTPKGKKAALLREAYGVLRQADAIRTVPFRTRKVKGGDL